MCLGRCILRAIASGAMASGGDTIAPSTKPTGQARPSNQWAATATAAAVNRTQPTASIALGRRLNLNSRQLISTAESI